MPPCYGRHRARTQASSESRTRSNRSTRHSPESTRTTIPVYKGNSDPFDCTAVPFTALDLSLVKDDRQSLVDIVWPAEISMRRNHPALLDRMWNVMPSILDSAAVVHAVISHAHHSRALRHLAWGQRDHSATVLAEQHKLRAVRHLRHLLERYSQRGGLDVLQQIRGASAQLAACGVISGDAGAAQIHFAGVKMAVDRLGGLRNMGPGQSECLVFSQVAGAWFNRSRPIFHPDEWDPGPWAEQGFDFGELPPSMSGRNPACVCGPCPRPSTISPGMQVTIDQVRELLRVEDLKLVLAASGDERATQVFRWSGLRKLAVGPTTCVSGGSSSSGTMGYRPPVPFDTVLCLTVRCFDRAIFEEHYYAAADAPFRLSQIFLAEVAGCLQRLDPPFPDVAGPQGASPHDRRIRADERRYDMLWVCSVGAHIEEHHLSLAARQAPPLPSSSISATGSRPQDTTGGSGLFTAGFAKLARTLGFEGFDDVATFLAERYLYCPRLQDATLRRLL
ncbi:hypothetical protein CLAIMM_10140 [Cladophialophora immunda]|nr:hypothetical protein CLAIMM_10140 [Cladophialophora immunda]